MDSNARRPKIVVFTILALFAAAPSPDARSQDIEYLPGSEAVGYGGSSVAHVHDASAVYWNPAALARLRGTFSFISLHDAFLTNYLAYARFFPLYGSVGFSIARFAASPQRFDSGTLAFARPLADDFSLGLNLDVNRFREETFPTFGVSVLFVPTDKSVLRDDEEGEESLRGGPIRLGVAVQNLPMGKRRLDAQVRAGLELQPRVGVPWVHTALQFDADHTTPYVGLGMALNSTISLYSGIASFDPESLGAGVTVRMSFVQAQIVYARDAKRLLFSLGFRISESPRRLAEKHYQAGIDRVREGRLETGLNEFRKYLEYRPREPRVLRFVTLLEKRFAARKARVDSLLEEGANLESQGRHISAALLYKKAREYDKDDNRAQARLDKVAPQVNKAIHDMVASGLREVELGDLLSAKIQFERVLMYDPQHKEAKRYLSEVTRSLHQQAEQHYLRGLGYYDQRNLSRARKEFSQALELYPEYPEARNSLSRTEEELAEVGSKVERILEEARQLEEDGKTIDAYRKYREIFEYEPEHEVASERLLALQPTISAIARQRLAEAQVDFRRGRLKNALAAATTAVDLDPRAGDARKLLEAINDEIQSRADAWSVQGEQAMQDEKWAEALRDFDAALSLSPNNARVRQLRSKALDQIDLAELQIQGQTAFDKGSYQEALSYFDQILERAPDDITAQRYADLSKKKLAEQVEEYFSRGMVFFAAENYEAAIREWDRALELDPDHVRALEYRAKAEQRLQALKSLP